MKNKFEFYYIAKPYHQNQAWGVLNIDPKTGKSIYEQFGFRLHNGEDIGFSKDKTVYCPIDAAVYRKLNQPNGGGIVVSILTDMYLWMDGKKAKCLIDFMHLEKILVDEGQKVSIGQKIAIADNTGFSTGEHCHVQCRRVVQIGKDLIDVDKNGANDSFDHSKYYTGLYAQDFIKSPLSSDEENAIIPVQKSLIEILKSYVDLLKIYFKLK